MSQIMMKFMSVALLVVGRANAFQTTTAVAAKSLRTTKYELFQRYSRIEPTISPGKAQGASRFPFLKRCSHVQSSGGKDSIRTTFRNRILRWARRTFFVVALFWVVHFSSLSPAFARGSGGRMGGSFKSSTRAPITRSLPRSSMYSRPIRSYHRPAPMLNLHRGYHVHTHGPTNVIGNGETAIITRTLPAPARRISMSDVLLVTGVGTVVSLNIMDRRRTNGSDGLESPLGPGVSVISLTTAINVPDRDNPNSILARLSRLALTARTDTRDGVQDLVSETALELLRQKDAIVSADSHYSHFSRTAEADREFNALSIGGRSKFTEETLRNFGGKQTNHRAPLAEMDAYPSATVAIVTINLCIEGDSTKVSKIRNMVELLSALSRIASDCQVDDCLLSAEVLWSPVSRTEKITWEDIYADYPSLVPL